VLAALLRSFLAPNAVALAHCDIPCGIYDPVNANIAAQTVTKMVELIGTYSPDKDPDRQNYIRAVKVKEEHAELCKREVLILWTDYFKPEHLEKYPKLHETVWKATKLCSRNKQNVDAQAATELRAAVKEISDIFWATKK
jgi:nickel superoxide dismutase